MAITLTPELDQLVNQTLATDRYKTIEDALRERSEHRHLHGGSVFSYSLADLLGFRAFVQFENLSCPRDDCSRESGESRYFDAVALACRAGLDGVEEDDSACGFLDGDAQVSEAFQSFGEEG